MKTFSHRASRDSQAQHIVSLTYHQRVKGRLRVVTEDGLEAGILTGRGEELREGEKLADDDGAVLEIRAHPEAVSVALTDSELLFAKACYHVGNRHCEVQIEQGRLLYLSDHVLDEMLVLLGLTVTHETHPFSPENGAYSHGHDSHSHSGNHDHSTSHDHSHGHSP